MEYHQHKLDSNLIVITADEQINDEHANHLALELEQLINSGLMKIIVDCQNVPYFSTVGIGFILLLHKRLTELGSDIKLANVEGISADVLKTLRLDRVFHMYPNIESARLSYE